MEILMIIDYRDEDLMCKRRNMFIKLVNNFDTICWFAISKEEIMSSGFLSRKSVMGLITSFSNNDILMSQEKLNSVQNNS